jgi:hypothetical protein
LHAWKPTAYRRRVPKKRVLQPTFVEGALQRLHAAALAAGAPAGAPGQANYFSHLHGIQSPPICEVQPCRLAGLCHALFELTQHQGEATWGKPILEAADEAANVQRALEKYLLALGPVLHQVVESHQRPFHDHDVCEQALRQLPVTIEFVAQLGDWEEALRERVWSRELRQPPGKKLADLLLTAVCQHLHWGGITYGEIAKLVLDDDQTGADERIRNRVKKSEDNRAVHPYVRSEPRRRNEGGAIPPPDSKRRGRHHKGHDDRGR